MSALPYLTPYYWQGDWITEAEAEQRIDSIGLIQSTLDGPLNAQTVLTACASLSARLRDQISSEFGSLYSELTDELGTAMHASDARSALEELAEALTPARLSAQLTAELGSTTPEVPYRAAFAAEAVEFWQPVGTLVHITPGNVAVAGFLSVVEGLLAGNVNIVKTSGTDGLFTQVGLALLAHADPTGCIRDRLVVLRFSSDNRDWLTRICRSADAVAVWGTEEAVAGVTQHIPSGCRTVEWGPKISVAYLDRTARADSTHLRRIAGDIFHNAQRTCTSPQVVYVDTTDHDQLFATAAALATELEAAADEFPVITPSTAEQAEVTNVVTVARLEEHLSLTRITSSPDGRWHVLADIRSALCASPLYGTIWVKPLSRENITAVLHPMRRYLQTVGLAADPDVIPSLVNSFFRAGALRITPLGEMRDGFAGESHDGVLALQRYSRRVSIRTSAAPE
ncbi:aldehyde dehydrogenase family protein [Streptomyces sp. NPDC059629]|uniref:aldehyde dehydrogenase family protein n=1 Tax=Streptomyces sp. NPDC059629 TaxID=3346889 RepID=UPI00367D3FCD